MLINKRAQQPPQRATDQAFYRNVLGHYPAGVVGITGRASDGAPVGMVATSFTSVSLDPPLVAFMPMKTSTTFAALRESGSFCVNVLAADQEGISRQLAVKGGDKFHGVDWRTEQTGAPVLHGAVAWIDCTIVSVHDEGDHYIVVGHVEDLAIDRSSSPLLYFQGGYGRVSSPSLTASGETDLITHLRVVDAVREEMVEASHAVGGEVVATALLRNEIVALATSGHPDPDRLPTRIGQRMPYTPPLGAAFAAWSEPAEWIRQVPGAQREYAASLVERVRERGWSASLSDGTPFSELERALAKLPLTGPGGDEIAEVEQMLDPSSPLYEPDLHSNSGAGNHAPPLRTVAVPVLDTNETAQVVFTAYGLPPTTTTDGLKLIVNRLQTLAAHASEVINPKDAS
ncbi:flavin reductase [Brevibacterium oceani]|uniref:flavin reductase n=1 Tax=Brevibacterium oceani TaxID=358099 RepID=UPI001B343B59|nr:flavin reductase [Brevibacterium oceani]